MATNISREELAKVRELPFARLDFPGSVQKEVRESLERFHSQILVGLNDSGTNPRQLANLRRQMLTLRAQIAQVGGAVEFSPTLPVQVDPTTGEITGPRPRTRAPRDIPDATSLKIAETPKPTE